MKCTIAEIFESIQGEGLHVGVRQIFIRFFGCNLSCQWCDTPLDKKNVQEYTLKSLIKKILAFGEDVKQVSLTGGEPLIQSAFLREFLPLLKRQGYQTYLETNGVLFTELNRILENIDVISMDIKLPSAVSGKENWKEHKNFLKLACEKEVFVKSVISGETKVDEVIKAVELIKSVNPKCVFILQLNSKENIKKLFKKCEVFQKQCLKYLDDVRIMPQMHKMLNVG